MNDMANHRLKWGKYKGTLLKDVPNDYLFFLINKTEILKGKMLVYVKSKLNLPKDNFKVVVEDSVQTDGEYFVEAYTKTQAINVCKKQYKIQNTQSFCGTTYSVYLIKN